ncbi:HK97 gp10 family phage protein [Nonomuraea sp. NPDC050786]|uniref:HK97 gp10 family phage protein n=1 Tax=Nonomuraea sp. NPDC050786 TaxID=3154840 RepID=UPI00340942E7
MARASGPPPFAFRVKVRNELRDLIGDFGGKMPKEVKAEIRPLLRKTGQGALMAVRSNASWSTRIPAATRLQISLTGKRPGVAVVTNRHKAPGARPLEHRGRRGRLRHPVFGNRDVWVTQPSNPFMTSEAPKWQAEVRKGIGDAVDQVARRHGFR